MRHFASQLTGLKLYSAVLSAIVLAVIPALSSAMNCDEATAALGADDSSQKVYFEKLLAKGEAAPLADFLKLWYPKDGDVVAEAQDYLLVSHTSQATVQIYDADNKYLVPQYAPDALYSWQPGFKLETIKSQMPDRQAWKGNPEQGVGQAVWATISAVSTYSYGLIPVRLKIRPQAKYAKSMMANDGEISYAFTGMKDFAIGDSSVVESYSVGTPELYDEIVNDIVRFSSGKPVVTYYEAPNFDKAIGINRVFSAGPGEREAQNEPTLKLRLLNLIKMILNHQGEIRFSSGACRNRALHYSTSKPTYINSRPSLGQ